MSEFQEKDIESESEKITPTVASDKFLETSKKWDKRIALLVGTSGGLSAVSSIGYLSSGNTEVGIIQGVSAGLMLVAALGFAGLSRR